MSSSKFTTIALLPLCFAFAAVDEDLSPLAVKDIGSVKVFKQALDEFSCISRLYPNLSKSTIFCGSMDRVTIDNILSILPFKKGKLLVRYLGVPLVAKKIGIKDYKSLILKVKTRIHDWKNKSLSYAGRTQLIASVLASIQVYWASVFKLPKNVTKDIERIFKAFLWNHEELQNGKAKVAWKEACQPKQYGGLRKSVWEIDKQTNDSRIWKSLLDLKETTRNHMLYKIGNRNKISIWHDRWSLMPAIDTIVSRRDIYTAGFSNNATMADFPNINADIQDKMLWCSKNGTITEFSSNQVWKDLRILNDEMKGWKVIWFSQNVPKHAFVLWMASKGKLVTQDKLAKWYPGKDWECPLCMQVEDSHIHLFFECEYSNTIWGKVQQMANHEKSSSALLKQIMGSVSSRLMTLRVKSSSAVKEVEDKWGITLMRATSGINSLSKSATLWNGVLDMA
ncbi:RNA-directed DNA polymerase, eukaryota, reverse transcriptase zinc-binding domain protein [Tanacetum coccineum]